MGVPVSKFKATSNSLTLKEDKSNSTKVKISSVIDSSDENFTNFHLVSTKTSLLTEETIKNGKHEEGGAVDDPKVCGATEKCDHLKYIDDNETSEESGLFGKETENDTDSGNASISSDTSHHEDSSNESELVKEPTSQPIIRLRKHSSSFRFYSNIANRLSTGSFIRNSVNSASANVIKFDQFNFRKVASKLSPGDLIEIQCQCTCYKGTQLRASINQRQRFRRTLQRQSFHQMPLSVSSSFSSKRNTSLVNRFSCISGSISELGSIPQSESRLKILQPSVPFVNSEQQCIEQYHYVYVEKVDLPKSDNSQSNESCSNPTTNTPLEHVWCFHVRPYQRVALLEDDRNLGIIKHETLESIVRQFLVEMEERHWQCNRSFRQPKLSIYYQIRNQEKLSQAILKQTFNAQPDLDRMLAILDEIKDSHVRYNKTMCNSEHYVTLWKYGIGWSRWVNSRTEIIRTLQHFVQRFSTMSAEGTLQLQGGECLQEQTNLIVQCFGLHGTKLEESIAQWMSSQIVIGKSSASPISCSPPSTTNNTLLHATFLTSLSSTSAVECFDIEGIEVTPEKITTSPQEGDNTLSTTTEDDNEL